VHQNEKLKSRGAVRGLENTLLAVRIKSIRASVKKRSSSRFTGVQTRVTRKTG
jgi:hypothetical protein